MVLLRGTAVYVVLVLLRTALASEGDRSPFYQNCLSKCNSMNCTHDGLSFNRAAQERRPVLHQLMLWNCNEECRYICMWRTIAGYTERRWSTPKFHGKWPFLRVLGMQEPGSVVGSVLNLAAHMLMHNRLQAAFSSRNTPLLWLWRIFSMVCIHAWIWSTIFHARDTPLTEFMDYACALSMVMILYISCVIRLSYGKSKLISILVTVTSLIYFTQHVQYLYSGEIDYEYNMKANVVPGAMAVLLWTVWGSWRYRRFPYTWRLLAFNALATLFMGLELLDFPPYMNLWDSHALWHLSTSILPFIFYRFVYDDLVYLRQSWPDLLEKSSVKAC